MFIERPPWFYRKLFPGSVWRLPAEEPCVYITFDDGPNAATTPRLLRVLDQLAVPATFFCVGDNVRRYPEAYRAILASGHTVGNHTYHHIRGFRLPASDYMADVQLAAKLIDSPLFRPPGRPADVRRPAPRRHVAPHRWIHLSAPRSSPAVFTAHPRTVKNGVPFSPRRQEL